MSTAASGERPAARDQAVRDALREALGAAVCWVVAEWMLLDMAYASVITLHMVQNQVTPSIWRRGLERFVGRALGIGCALVIVTLFHHTPLLGIAFTALAIVVFSYIHFAGWWAQTFMYGAIYLASVVEAGHYDPAGAFTAARIILENVFLGVVVADLANWLLGFERSLVLQPGTHPLFPLRPEWLSRAGMAAVTILVTQAAIRFLGWTGSQALVSVLVLAVMAERRALLLKGRQRLEGALLGAAWGFASAILVARVPHLPLVLSLFFLGMFVAGYFARTSPNRSYTGVQMGYVIALVLMAPPAQAGSLTPAVQRVEGVFVGIAVAVLVSSLWPGFPAGPAPQT
jgi:uncharacterized membrane protein YgaE (UPF0421/DUF939 family)